MFLVYNILSQIVYAGIRLAASFNGKLRLFVRGRSQTFERLASSLTPDDRVLWMHVASLGEYEQGLPLLKKIRQTYPQHKLVLSFFSPSGFEIVKDKTPADVVVYLPFDTKKNARRWLDTVKPEAAIFIKYEFWPLLLNEMMKRNILLLSVSAIFRPTQLFFKPYGGWMRKSLQAFEHFFVQNETSVRLLNSIGIKGVTLAGDTRFDRVLEILERDNRLDFMEAFTKGKTCVVAGSTWPEDEIFWIDFLNKNSLDEVVFVLAPHDVGPAHIGSLLAQLPQGTLRYSQIEKAQSVSGGQILVIDTIGLLTKIYSYAHLAYVGGGMKQGLHNVLEPAVFGIPVIIGKEYAKFDEALQLVQRGGIVSVANQQEFNQALDKLLNVIEEQKKLGEINRLYVSQKTGATALVMKYLSERLKN